MNTTTIPCSWSRDCLSNRQGDGEVLYFAYGSNMDWNRMKKRCPSSQFVCVAELSNCKLTFPRANKSGKGVASVEPQDGHVVWGVVYRIDETEIGALNRAEGYSPGRYSNSYIREERHVSAQGKVDSPLAVQIYIAVPKANPPLPTESYKRFIVGGAEFWHLPADYVRKLEKIKVQATSSGTL